MEREERWIEILRRSLQHADEPLPAGGWEALERDLAAAARRRRVFDPLWRRIAAAVAVVAVAVLIGETVMNREAVDGARMPEMIADWAVQGAVTPDAVRKGFEEHPDCRALFLVSPSYYGICSDLEAIAEVIRRHDIFVISDEIYAELTYKEKHVSIVEIEGMQERTILINGFSKAFAMTGWRLGYACGPREIVEQMTKIHQYAIMCAPTTSQYAAVEALRNGDDDVKEMRMAYNQRRRYLVHALREMGLQCFEPFGAFYVFPSIKKFGLSADEFATRLLMEEKVAIVPGTAFGDCGEGFLRISYAYSIENLKIALGKIEAFITRLRNGKK